MIDIRLMDTVDGAIIEAFEHLIPQLTQYSHIPTRDMLDRLARSQASYVYLARFPDEKGKIVGMATLATFLTPTGVHAWIEDVIVDASMRRMGIGKALTQACIEKAGDLGLREVNLTSRPSREAANRLYQSMGFIQRETNVYRYPLPGESHEPTA